jgi:hypothetical protein
MTARQKLARSLAAAAIGLGVATTAAPLVAKYPITLGCDG